MCAISLAGISEKKLMDLKQLRLQEAERFKEGATADLYQALLTADIEYYVDLYVDFVRSVRIVSDLQFEAIIRENDTVFEGAQGVMLDQVYGTFPFCTRSTTTFENALTLLREAKFDGAITRIGLLRAYSTRHGAGPFVTEDTSLAIPPCHNQLNPWQGNFRQGWFDGVAARYALKACGGVDILAITNIDRLYGLSTVKVCTEYRMPDDRFIDEHGDLRLFNTFDKELLANRSQALSRTTPVYVEFPGMSGGYSAEVETYLDTLSSVIEHPINAYSATPDAAKIYRAFSLVSQN
jgi:adenylosuccinate synthase